MSTSPLVWIKAHQAVAALAGAGGVAGLALLRKRKSAGSSASGAPAVANTSTSDLYNALQPQLAQLTGAIQAADAQIAVGANSQLPGANPGGSMGSTIAQPPPPPPLPAPAAPPVSTGAPAPIVGATPDTVGVIPAGANYGYMDFPTTTPAGSVQAPSGGQFLYGQWNGNQLVSGTYKLPDGSTKTVGR